MKRILILTADAGYGHRSAAKALAEALPMTLQTQCQIEIVNPLNDPQAPSLLRESQSDYDRIVRELPDLYKMGYEATDETIPNALIGGGVTVLLFDVLRRLLKTQQPDLIITTYPLYQPPLDALFMLMPPAIPVITVVTDLSWVHRSWFHRAATALVVPTNEVRDQAIAQHIPLERVHVLGIPVSPRYGPSTQSKTESRRALGWDPDRRTVLAVSSSRVLHLGEMLRVLNHSGLPLQLAVVAGGDAEQFAAYTATEWHLPTHVYNFVDNLPEMMHAADCIMCKAGGLIVSEALACGLPMLLTEVIPGQEQGNAEYVTKSQAGVQVASPVELLEILFHWLEDGAHGLVACSHRAAQAGHPDAATKIAALAKQWLC